MPEDIIPLPSAKFRCTIVHISPSAGEDTRLTTEPLTMCLRADGRVRFQAEVPLIKWRTSALRQVRARCLRKDSSIEGTCCSDGHFVLRAVPAVYSTAEEEEQRSWMLAGRLMPPCSISGSVSRLGQQEGRFEVVVETIELPSDGASSGLSKKQHPQPATWDLALSVMKWLKAHQPKQMQQNEEEGEQEESRSDFSTYLPTEAIGQVIFLLPVSSVASLSACSRMFHWLCSSAWVWKRLFYSDFLQPRHLLREPPTHRQLPPKQQKRPGLADLSEGFSTSIETAETIWNSWPWPVPGEVGGEGKGKQGTDVHWKQRYKQMLQQEGLDWLVLNEGDFVLNGYTRNDSAPSKNITRAEGIRLRLKHGLVWAEMSYLSGSRYNPTAGAVWIGCYSAATREIWWREKYLTHPGLFHYTGRVIDHRTIKGTYRWDANQACGSFLFQLAE